MACVRVINGPGRPGCNLTLSQQWPWGERRPLLRPPLPRAGGEGREVGEGLRGAHGGQALPPAAQGQAATLLRPGVPVSWGWGLTLLRVFQAEGRPSPVPAGPSQSGAAARPRAAQPPAQPPSALSRAPPGRRGSRPPPTGAAVPSEDRHRTRPSRTQAAPRRAHEALPASAQQEACARGRTRRRFQVKGGLPAADGRQKKVGGTGGWDGPRSSQRAGTETGTFS